MRKGKLLKYAELATFGNVFQIPLHQIEQAPFSLKSRWAPDFFKNEKPITLELGCGKGEYTLALAEKFPQENFIGVDIKGARLWRGSKTALEKKINNVAFIRTNIENLVNVFSIGEISEIWLTFPDPQPQKSREKKRLTSPRFLDMFRSLLTPMGRIHLKTDNKSLFEYSLESVRKSGGTILFHTFDLYNERMDDDILSVKTYYEGMFLEEGLKICYMKFVLNGPDGGIK
ncbi:MAG: tRNA (guanosine(46)-N7)-methyltransferase TrmB [Bacteroidetes bacterium]|nr:tRNA (guanosine(46)-N7)-methyltransferase TrmB [Bacteroidota bacterium]